jgi:hypothetical protein
VPVPTHVAVDGSVPDVPGVLSLPSTAVGDGDGAVVEGDEPAGGADGVGWLDEAVGGALPEAGAVCVGDPDGWTEGAGDVAWDGDPAGDGEVAAALGDAVRGDVADGVALAWPGSGPSATGRGWTASTVAPSATSARRAAIGTMPIRVPSGRSSKQFGQKPETGVAS